MNDFEDKLLRKIDNRLSAIANMGASDMDESGELADFNFEISKVKELINQLSYYIYCAESLNVCTSHFEIDSNNKKIGRLIVKAKKGIRKILQKSLGWYINPILERQTLFNTNMLMNLSALKQIAEEQEKVLNKTKKELAYVFDRLNVSCDLDLLNNASLDYLKFENQFRGPRDYVMASQSVYIDYFKYCGGAIIDIGCGRGEFLELMKKNGVKAIGVDSYQPFIDYCRNIGLEVEKADALTYLSQLPDEGVSGIFMSHVVEHLSNDYIIKLIEIASKKIYPGGYFVIETPNPQCLTTYRNFYVDLGHHKPIHYNMLEFIFKSFHFSSVEKYHNPSSVYHNLETKEPIHAFEIKGDSISNLDEFNNGIFRINEVLFGNLDYTLIAKK